jgi:hypothetical protein
MMDDIDFSSAEAPVTLPQQEVILWSGHPSWWSYAPVLFLAGILIYVFGAGLLLTVAVLLHRKAHYYTITDRRITAHNGFLRRKKQEIMLSDILSIEVDAPSLPIAAGVADVTFRSKQGELLSFRSVYPAPEIRKLVLAKMTE